MLLMYVSHVHRPEVAMIFFFNQKCSKPFGSLISRNIFLMLTMQLYHYNHMIALYLKEIVLSLCIVCIYVPLSLNNTKLIYALSHSSRNTTLFLYSTCLAQSHVFSLSTKELFLMTSENRL